MKLLARDEIVPRGVYESLRSEYRDAVIELKRRRRVAVGDRVSIVFENRETLRFQVQEMLRVERIDDPAAVQNELDVYNQLVPGEGELSATLFIEIPELSRVREELDRLIGIDQHVSLLVGEREIRASFDPTQMEQDRISAVQYIRFRIDPETQRLFGDPATRVRLRTDHPNYRHDAELVRETRDSLLADLRGECPPLVSAERWRETAASPVAETLEETARVRVVRLAPGHLLVEPREPVAGSLLGAKDEALGLELLRAAERHASALRREGGAVRVSIDTSGDRPRWHLVAGD